jgi:hypothetical protein
MVGSRGVPIDREKLVQVLGQEFPALAEELSDEVGLVHLEMACFARYTQLQIEGENRAELQRCFVVAGRILSSADADVENAMYVSYLEHLNLTDGKRSRAWAKALMPPKLFKGWQAIMAYNEEMARRLSPPSKRTRSPRRKRARG